MSHPMLRIGSRASALARWQAEHVAARVGCPTAMVWIQSGGDKDRATALTAFGGTGIFTAEVNLALLQDRVDVGVHSLKDLPAGRIPGLVLGCVPERADPRDALIARNGWTLATLPPGSRIGTGSPRRQAQLQRHRPDLQFEGIRGNVDTRLARVAEGDLDAVVLACAGLDRIARAERITERIDPRICVPAAAQGALGLTIREGDAAAEAALHTLACVRTTAAVEAERSALHTLGAGCHAPVGALARVAAGRIQLHVRVCEPDGRGMLETEQEGPLTGAREVGEQAARELLAQGAGPWVDTADA